MTVVRGGGGGGGYYRLEEMGNCLRASVNVVHSLASTIHCILITCINKTFFFLLR